MTPERWQKVKEIFQDALEREPEERAAFISNSCGDDHGLRQEVQSLMASHEKDGSFIDSPPHALANSLFQSKRLSTGQRIGHYEILSALGAGGMGEVYLAKDLKLTRQVALKVLPSLNFDDEQAGKRLLREARAAATLDHPNICGIYEISEDDGLHYIAMQYLDGETLEMRMANGALSFDEALDLSTQIADGLADAHAHDIVHRDIKPANIVITRRGQQKFLHRQSCKGCERLASGLLLIRTWSRLSTRGWATKNKRSHGWKNPTTSSRHFCRQLTQSRNSICFVTIRASSTY